MRDLTGGVQICAVPSGILCTLQYPCLATRAVAMVDRTLGTTGGLLVGADHALVGPGGHGGDPRQYQVQPLNNLKFPQTIPQQNRILDLNFGPN